MLLEPMRYKDYIWPHNPRTYSISYERQIAVHKVPFGRYCTQDLGMSCRVMRGEGEFVGEGAYEEFKKLATVFYGGGAGLLIHPVWQISSAYFTALKLEQEPLANYVRYSFEFREDYEEYDRPLQAIAGTNSTEESRGADVRHQAAQGETLWSIAGAYGVDPEKILQANPTLKNPNPIQPGDEVVIPC